MAERFDYYYGIETQQFAYYMVPKILFKHERFRQFSADSKLLYGIMQNRASLSMQNGWCDEEGRTYIICSVEEIMDLLGCGKNKAIQLLDELETNMGLIIRKRQGLGKPNLIYVLNCLRLVDDEGNTYLLDQHGEVTSSNVNSKPQEVPKSNFKKFENQTSRSLKNKLQEVSKSNFKKFENQTSRSLKNKLQEVSNPHSSNTDNSNTDNNETDNNETDNNYIYINNIGNPSYQSITDTGTDSRIHGDKMDKMDEIRICREKIKQNIQYDYLTMRYGKTRVDEITNLLVDEITSDQDQKWISGTNVPADMVKERLMGLTQDHIEYVFESLDNCPSRIRNIKAYLLAALYNASTTMDNYTRASVNADQWSI